MHKAEDEPLFAARAAGIEVTIRVPSDTRRGGQQQETRSFRATPQGPAGRGGLAAVLGRDQDRDGVPAKGKRASKP